MLQLQYITNIIQQLRKPTIRLLTQLKISAPKNPFPVIFKCVYPGRKIN